MTTRRAQNFSLTWNNPPADHADRMRLKVGQDNVRFIKYGVEISTTGTKHLQMVVTYKGVKTPVQVRNQFPGCHVEIAGCLQRMIAYVGKGTMDSSYFKTLDNPTEDATYGVDAEVFSFGDEPVTKEAARKKGAQSTKKIWDDIKQAAVEGRLDDIDSKVYVQNYRTLQSIAKDHIKPMPDLSELKNFWVFGPPGLCKTVWVKDTCKDLQYNKPVSKWWDGYTGQEDVLVDEVEKKAADYNMGHYLKEWAQHKYFLGETKGGMLPIRPKRIFITSNYSIDEIFGEDATMVAALKRRFQQVQFTDWQTMTFLEYEQPTLDKLDWKITFEKKFVCSIVDCPVINTHTHA